MPVAQETDKPAPDLTQLVDTVQVRLTQAVIATLPVINTLTPSTVVLSSPTPTLTANSPSQTLPPGQPTRTQQSLQACDQAGAGMPIDITIPDNTLMEPGQSFTKIWRLQNVGECTWTTTYRIFLFSGDPLGAANNIALSRQVSPGDSVDIAIDMIAPSRAGAFQGNWKLRNPDGMAFGIGPSASAPFWVRIVVEVTPTPTVTRTPTPTFMITLATLTPDLNTPTPNPTATETPPTSLPLMLNPGDSLDFDSGELNRAPGSDVLYESNPDGLHRFSPQSGSEMGIFGEQLPTLPDCENAELEPALLVATNLIQRYVCYRTDLGQYGWAFMREINPNTYTARLEFFTWTAP